MLYVICTHNASIFPLVSSTYLICGSVCLGAAGREEECLQGLQEVPSLVRRTNHALEAFLLRRALKVPPSPSV